MSEFRAPAGDVPAAAGSGDSQVPIVPAASTIVLRGVGPEVLLMHRHPKSSFVPSAWVFPGGTMDNEDRLLASELLPHDELAPFRVCAVRELFEESGVWIGESVSDSAEYRRKQLARESDFRALATTAAADFASLVPVSRWITPSGMPKRFDTLFFAVAVAEDTIATPDETEGVEVLWITPSEAIERHRAGTLPMVLPTLRNLAALTSFNSAPAFLASRTDIAIPTFRPVIINENGRRKIVLPGES